MADEARRVWRDYAALGELKHLWHSEH